MQKSLTQKLGMTVAAIAMAATGLFSATEAQAVPAFARQTGMTCDSCHFQSYPVINGMGRSFKAGGYTMQGTQPAIESADLNMPSTLNMSVIWKFFLNSNTNGGYDMAAQDEVSFLVGGRVNASTGFLWEVGSPIVEGDATAGYSTSMFLSQKIHFNVGDSFAVIPFITDAAGPAYGMELMNTGLERPIRPIEKRHAVTGAGKSGWVSSATGVALVFHTPELMVNYTMYAPAFSGSTGADTVDLAKTAGYVRASYFMDLAGFDTGIGFATKTGSYDIGAGAVTVGGTYIDFQMQGDVAGAPLGFYLVQATGKDAAADSTLGLTVKYTAIPHFEVFAASNSGKVASADWSYTAVGFEYLTSLNTKIIVSSNDDNGTTGTLIGFETAM